MWIQKCWLSFAAMWCTAWEGKLSKRLAGKKENRKRACVRRTARLTQTPSISDRARLRACGERSANAHICPTSGPEITQMLISMYANSHLYDTRHYQLVKWRCETLSPMWLTNTSFLSASLEEEKGESNRNTEESDGGARELILTKMNRKRETPTDYHLQSAIKLCSKRFIIQTNTYTQA